MAPNKPTNTPQAIINEIDKILIDSRKVLDNFHVFEQDPDVGKDKSIYIVSRMLTDIDYKLLALLQSLRLSTADYEARRRIPNSL